jgi:hypothetical protein
MTTRDRNKGVTPLQQRLQKLEEEARADASCAKPGLEQDALLKKAGKANAVAEAAKRLKA